MHSSVPGDLTPLSSRDRPYQELEERLSSLAATVSHWQRDLETAASRASRLEGAFSVLLTSLEGWKSDIREVASRTESRVLRGLEVLDSRIGRVQPQGDMSQLAAHLEQLEAVLAERLAGLERRMGSPAELTAVLDGLAALERRLKAIEEMPPAAPAADGFDDLSQRLRTIEERVSMPSDDRLADLIADGFESLNRRLQALEERPATAGGAGFEVPAALTDGIQEVGNRLQAIEQRVAAPGDEQLLTRLGQAFDQFNRRLQAIEQRPALSGEQLSARLGEIVEAIGGRLQALEQKASAPDPQLLGRMAEGVDAIGRRVDALAQRASSTESMLPARLAEGFEAVSQRLRAIDQKVAEQDAALFGRLTDTNRDLERRIAESNANLERRIAETQEAFLTGLEALRAGVAKLSDPAQNPQLEVLTASLKALESRLGQSQEALTRKLDSVQAESDENNATQLRYLAGLEELQAAVAKRIQALETLVANPLDAQQWERLARGLEFLDSRLAQSYDSVANRLDTAIAALTATLDNRAASGQEANLKSAERLWRALRGLEDQITSSYQMVNQSQERLEAASQNLAASIEDLRAVSGARSGHTEKLLMEGLENLDSRFAQNLMAVSESLGSALFALNKATGEWRSELFNATEESEERLVSHISQTEAKLAGDLRAGLDAIGRREERMLALILGGGPPLPASTEVREVREVRAEPKPPAKTSPDAGKTESPDRKKTDRPG